MRSNKNVAAGCSTRMPGAKMPNQAGRFMLLRGSLVGEEG